jgi:hypothetical protein
MNSKKKITLSWLAWVIVFLSSCTAAVNTPLATLIPGEEVPTIIAMTVEAKGLQETELIITTEEAIRKVTPTFTPKQTIEIVASDTPTQVSPAPTYTQPPPKPTQYFPPPENVPSANLQILSPGPGSTVISPFTLTASIIAGTEALVHVELLGEDGRLLLREVQNYQSSEGGEIAVSSEISYGTNSDSESGRLQISLHDENGRIVDLTSVDLILLSHGEQDLYEPPDQFENIVIESPRQNTLIQGGMMRVSGLARPRSNQPLMIELLTSDGRIVGTRQVAVVPTPGSMYASFAIDVPYHVEAAEHVRLKVWEPGSIITGIVDLSSLEVILSP